VTEPTPSDGVDASAAAPTPVAPEHGGSAGGRARWTRRLLTVGPVLLLVVGVVVCVFGRLAANSASDDLATANNRLHAQQHATRAAQACETALRGQLAPIASAAQTLFATAGGIADQSALLDAAQHDAETAGAQGRIDDFNNAIGRLNAAADAGNRGVDAARAQGLVLTQQASALPKCSGSAASTAYRISVASHQG
jgi:hypothetical protein